MQAWHGEGGIRGDTERSRGFRDDRKSISCMSVDKLYCIKGNHLCSAKTLKSHMMNDKLRNPPESRV